MPGSFNVGPHRPLATDNSIRLLHLQPSYGLTRTNLSASLVEVELSLAPPYEALSYTWGKHRELTRFIHVNGFKVFITNNLADALQRIRLPVTNRIIWCDALCISQTDVVEKAQQVRMIGDIFRSATNVLVWLGRHGQNSEYLFKKRKKALLQADHPVTTDEGDVLAEAWCCLALREYWERTWIVQEIVLAKSVLLLCGNNTLTWENITSTYSGGDEHTLLKSYLQFYKLKHFDQGLSRIRTLVERRSQEQQLRKLSPSTYAFTDIFNLIIACKDTKCFDKRDKVYALLSLSETNTNIDVDYMINVEDLFIQLFITETRLSYDEFNLVAESMGLHTLRGAYRIVSALFQDGQFKPHITVKLASWVLRSVHRLVCLENYGAAGLARFHTRETQVLKLTDEDHLLAAAVKLKQELARAPGNQDLIEATTQSNERSQSN